MEQAAISPMEVGDAVILVAVPMEPFGAPLRTRAAKTAVSATRLVALILHHQRQQLRPLHQPRQEAAEVAASWDCLFLGSPSFAIAC